MRKEHHLTDGPTNTDSGEPSLRTERRDRLKPERPGREEERRAIGGIQRPSAELRQPEARFPRHIGTDETLSCGSHLPSRPKVSDHFLDLMCVGGAAWGRMLPTDNSIRRRGRFPYSILAGPSAQIGRRWGRVVRRRRSIDVRWRHAQGPAR